MDTQSNRERVSSLLRDELAHITRFNRSDRQWQVPFFAALASGLPLLIGAYVKSMPAGLTASLGGLVFLYLPMTALRHRMNWLAMCSFGMCTCYALGLLGHLFPATMTTLIVLITVVVALMCRLHSVPPPASLFFVMVAAIGSNSRIDRSMLPMQLTLFAAGCVSAVSIAFIFSVINIKKYQSQSLKPKTTSDLERAVIDSALMGSFVGLSIAIAQVLKLDRPYWVPISCVAIIQGASLRAAWVKQFHRVVGTGLGLLLAWALLSVSQDRWLIASMVVLLTFIVESLVVRHYGLAVVFITPLTLFLAESASPDVVDISALMNSRFVDTLLGSVIGVAGAACIHSPSLRKRLSAMLSHIKRHPFTR